jgi:hypothetical protein
MVTVGLWQDRMCCCRMGAYCSASSTVVYIYIYMTGVRKSESVLLSGRGLGLVKDHVEYEVGCHCCSNLVITIT